MIIDLVLIILMVIAIWKGFNKGLIVAVFSLVAYVVGISAALKLSTVVAGRLQQSTSVTGQWLPLLSFLLVFVIVLILVRLGAKLIEKTFQLAMLGWLNRMAGIILYALIYAMIFSVGLFFAHKMRLVDTTTIATSVTYPYIAPLGPKVIDGIGVVLPFFRDMFNELAAFFDLIGQKAT